MLRTWRRLRSNLIVFHECGVIVAIAESNSEKQLRDRLVRITSAEGLVCLCCGGEKMSYQGVRPRLARSLLMVREAAWRFGQRLPLSEPIDAAAPSAAAPSTAAPCGCNSH